MQKIGKGFLLKLLDLDIFDKYAKKYNLAEVAIENSIDLTEKFRKLFLVGSFRKQIADTRHDLEILAMEFEHMIMGLVKKINI